MIHTPRSLAREIYGKHCSRYHIAKIYKAIREVGILQADIEPPWRVRYILSEDGARRVKKYLEGSNAKLPHDR